MNLFQLCLLLSNRQIIQSWADRFSWKANFGNSWGFMESKVYTEEEISQTGIRLHWSQPALQTRTTTYGNIGDNYSSTLRKASNMSVHCCSKEHCLGQTLGQTQQVSRNVTFCNYLKLCFSYLKDPSPRGFQLFHLYLALIFIFIQILYSLYIYPNEEQPPSDLRKPSP